MPLKVIKLIVLFAVLFVSVSSKADGYNLVFEKNSKVGKIAEAYSLDCVDWAERSFNVQLDWSDSSIQLIEKMIDGYSKHIAQKPATQERIQDFSKMFGFYIGEVYRKNHGGVEWGDVVINGSKYYGMAKTDTNEPFIWPTVKANKRIVLGKEENVWHYYQAITEN